MNIALQASWISAKSQGETESIFWALTAASDQRLQAWRMDFGAVEARLAGLPSVLGARSAPLSDVHAPDPPDLLALQPICVRVGGAGQAPVLELADVASLAVQETGNASEAREGVNTFESSGPGRIVVALGGQGMQIITADIH